VFGKYPKWELITSHSFRRSFATNSCKKIATPILMSITGHSRESTFLKYINKHIDKDDNATLFALQYKKMMSG
jgi:integrase